MLKLGNGSRQRSEVLGWLACKPLAAVTLDVTLDLAMVASSGLLAFAVAGFTAALTAAVVGSLAAAARWPALAAALALAFAFALLEERVERLVVGLGLHRGWAVWGEACLDAFVEGGHLGARGLAEPLLVG